MFLLRNASLGMCTEDCNVCPRLEMQVCVQTRSVCMCRRLCNTCPCLETSDCVPTMSVCMCRRLCNVCCYLKTSVHVVPRSVHILSGLFKILIQAMKLQFEYFRDAWSCREHCVRYLYARKYVCWGEVCVMYVLTMKCHFLHDKGPYASVEGCVVYVLTWKHQFMNFGGPLTWLVDCLILVHTMKLKLIYFRGLWAYTALC